LIATPRDDQSVFLGWRLLASDPADTVFNIYRRAGDGELSRLNPAPISSATFFVDSSCDPSAANVWGIRVAKWEWERETETTLFDGRDSDCVSNNGTKSKPCLCADITSGTTGHKRATTNDGV